MGPYSSSWWDSHTEMCTVQSLWNRANNRSFSFSKLSAVRVSFHFITLDGVAGVVAKFFFSFRVRFRLPHSSPPLSSVIDSVSQSYEVSQSVFLLVVLLFPSRSRGLLFLHNLLSQWIVSTQLTLTIFGLLLTTTSARPTCPRALLLTD